MTNAAPKRRWRVSGGGGYSDGEPGLSELEIIFIVISVGVLMLVILCCIKLGGCDEQDDEQETQETAQNEFGHYGFAKANSGYLPDQGTNVHQTQHI